MRGPSRMGGGRHPMILVLADANDHPALWLRNRLGVLMSTELRVVTPIQFLCGRSIVHRLSSDATDFSFENAQGERIGSDQVDGVVNRFLAVPTAHLARIAATERRYVEDELHAFLLGWLASLECPLLNPPSPECLAGAFHGPIALRHHAALAGLVCDPVSIAPGQPEPPVDELSASAQFHFALDGRLIGPVVDADSRDQLLIFARLWGTRLLQIQSEAVPEGRRLLGATSFVDFRLGGDLLVRAIAEALR